MYQHEVESWVAILGNKEIEQIKSTVNSIIAKYTRVKRLLENPHFVQSFEKERDASLITNLLIAGDIDLVYDWLDSKTAGRLERKTVIELRAIAKPYRIEDYNILPKAMLVSKLKGILYDRGNDPKSNNN